MSSTEEDRLTVRTKLFWFISVSGRTRVRTDRFRSMMRKGVAVFTGPP